LTFSMWGMLGADIDGDGTTELITVEGTPLGIYVYDVSDGVIAPDAQFSVFGTPGRAALTASGELDRTGYGDTVSSDPSDATRDASGPASYTVSVEPTKKMCTCAGCRALTELATAGTTESDTGAVWQDDLLSTVPVA
jgi:hypothetical protein